LEKLAKNSLWGPLEARKGFRQDGERRADEGKNVKKHWVLSNHARKPAEWHSQKKRRNNSWTSDALTTWAGRFSGFQTVFFIQLP
jgi:hypothetical protein